VAEVVLQRQHLLEAGFHRQREHLVIVAAALFGAVHRRVRVAHEYLGGIPIPGEDRYADAGYALLDVASSAVTGCLSPPSVSSLRGGGCGGPGMSASTWTADGRLVYSVPGAGQSGVFVHDPATGVQTSIPNMSAGKASLSPDGDHVTFAGGGYVWLAGLDGSNLTLLAEGHSPAWQPLP